MTDYHCFEGRPESRRGRSDAELACYDLLDALGISYSRCDHPPASTMEACEKIDALLGVSICKNLFLTNRQHSAFYLLLMPADKVFKTKELSGQIGSSRLSFASGEEMEALLGCAPGSASLLGLLNDPGGSVRLLVDRDLFEEPFFGCHPCINTSSLKMRSGDVFGALVRALGHEMTPVQLAGE